MTTRADDADDDLTALPKAHLHLHLTGSMRRSTLLELGAREGVGIEELPDRFADWAAFGNTYRTGKQVLRDADDLARVVREIVADAAADGAVWVELSVSPSEYRGIAGDDETTMGALTTAASEAAAATGTGVGLVVAPDRIRDAVTPEEMARLATRWAGRGVVGYGLAGDEREPGLPFATAAAIARDGGLRVVPHAGELGGPDAIRETIATMAPDRIMHGVRAVEDPELVAELADRRVCLDVCPSSNVALGVTGSFAEHPLPTLLRAGVPCSINADNPWVFATGLAEEYRRARHRLGLTDAELATAARSSLLASAAPAAIVGPALAGIAAWEADRPRR